MLRGLSLAFKRVGSVTSLKPETLGVSVESLSLGLLQDPGLLLWTVFWMSSAYSFLYRGLGRSSQAEAHPVEGIGACSLPGSFSSSWVLNVG